MTNLKQYIFLTNTTVYLHAVMLNRFSDVEQGHSQKIKKEIRER